MYDYILQNTQSVNDICSDFYESSEEPETRDAWWTEIRTEIRTHCRAMGCHAVLGYTEHTTIW